MKSMHILLLVVIMSAVLVLSGCWKDVRSPDKNLTKNASAQNAGTTVSSADAGTQSGSAEAGSAPTGIRKEPEEMSNPKPEPVQEPEPESGPYCGDGVCSGAENCDRCFEDCACKSPAECHNGACKIPECGSDNDCRDKDPCTKDICYFVEHPNAYCGHDIIKVCKNNDGCCPKGCNGNDDVDCEAECGNGECEPGETTDTCYEDCGPVCGNRDCEDGGDFNTCDHDCCEPDKWYNDGETCNCPGGYSRVTDMGVYMCTKS